MIRSFTFRPITETDIPTLHRWRNLPHVSQWWDPAHPSLRYAYEEYRFYMQPDSGVDAYIVVLDEVDIGYIQKWQVEGFPDYRPFVTLDNLTTGIDVFIGNTAFLHKGYGTQLMQAFIRDYVFNDPAVPDCIIDPVPENAAAIRAYEKVGFVHEKTFIYDSKGVYFMRLTRARFMNRGAESPQQNAE